MKIEGLEFIDWLHKIRKESENERRKTGISGEEWLKEITRDAERILGHKFTPLPHAGKSTAKV